MVKGLRCYSNGKLVSWIQQRCQVCQRFLSKNYTSWRRKFCSGCAKKEARINAREYRRNHKDYFNLKNAVYWHPDKFNVGDIV